MLVEAVPPVYSSVPVCPIEPSETLGPAPRGPLAPTLLIVGIESVPC